MFAGDDLPYYGHDCNYILFISEMIQKYKNHKTHWMRILSRQSHIKQLQYILAAGVNEEK